MSTSAQGNARDFHSESMKARKELRRTFIMSPWKSLSKCDGGL